MSDPEKALPDEVETLKTLIRVLEREQQQTIEELQRTRAAHTKLLYERDVLAGKLKHAHETLLTVYRRNTASQLEIAYEIVKPPTKEEDI